MPHPELTTVKSQLAELRTLVQNQYRTLGSAAPPLLQLLHDISEKVEMADRDFIPPQTDIEQLTRTAAEYRTQLAGVGRILATYGAFLIQSNASQAKGKLSHLDFILGLLAGAIDAHPDVIPPHLRKALSDAATQTATNSTDKVQPSPGKGNSPLP